MDKNYNNTPFKQGDKVIIKKSGIEATVTQIGQHGLIGVHVQGNPIMGTRAYSPVELELVEKKGA